MEKVMEVYFGISIFVVWAKVMLIIYMKVKHHAVFINKNVLMLEFAIDLIAWPIWLTTIVYTFTHYNAFQGAVKWVSKQIEIEDVPYDEYIKPEDESLE